MKYKTRDLANLLLLLARGASSKELPGRIDGFVKYIQNIHVVSMLPGIIKAFDEEWNRVHGISKVRITGARKLSKGQLEEVKKLLGDGSEISEVTDPKLLGGIKMMIDDLLIDASLKRRLEDLKKVFAS